MSSDHDAYETLTFNNNLDDTDSSNDLEVQLATAKREIANLQQRLNELEQIKQFDTLPPPKAQTFLNYSPDNGPQFNSFFSALESQSIQPIPFQDDFAYLPLVQQQGHSEQPTILAGAEEGSRLFIRPCYPKLWNIIRKCQQKPKGKRPQGIIVTGNPGVGKSSFLAYLMKQYRSFPSELRPNIVFERRQGTDREVAIITSASPPEVHYFHPSAEIPLKFINLLSQFSTIRFIDVSYEHLAIGTIHPCNAFTIIAAAPLQSRRKSAVEGWWKMSSNSPPILFMPCWTREELQVCRRLTCPTLLEFRRDSTVLGARLLPALTRRTVDLRMEQFGGIARICLAKISSTVENAILRLDGIVKQCDVSAICRLQVSDIDNIPNMSSLLLHYVVNEKNFRQVQIEFASRYVLQQLIHRYDHERSTRAVDFLELTAGLPDLANARGLFFEEFAHTMLPKGGSFCVRKLAHPLTSMSTDSSQIIHVSIPRSTAPSVMTLPNASAIADLLDLQYGRPSAKNFPTVDSVMAPNMLFQMTVSASHEVNIDGLAAAVAALRKRRHVPVLFYFVVPPDQFPAFRMGSFVSKHDPAPPIPSESDIQFFVLQAYSPSTSPYSAPQPILDERKVFGNINEDDEEDEDDEDDDEDDDEEDDPKAPTSHVNSLNQMTISPTSVPTNPDPVFV